MLRPGDARGAHVSSNAGRRQCTRHDPRRHGRLCERRASGREPGPNAPGQRARPVQFARQATSTGNSGDGGHEGRRGNSGRSSRRRNRWFLLPWIQLPSVSLDSLRPSQVEQLIEPGRLCPASFCHGGSSPARRCPHSCLCPASAGDPAPDPSTFHALARRRCHCRHGPGRATSAPPAPPGLPTMPGRRRIAHAASVGVSTAPPVYLPAGTANTGVGNAGTGG